MGAKKNFPEWYGQWVPCPHCRDEDGARAKCWSCMGSGGHVGARVDIGDRREYCIYSLASTAYCGGSAQNVIHEALFSVSLSNGARVITVRREGQRVAILNVSSGEDIVVNGVKIKFLDAEFKAEYMEA